MINHEIKSYWKKCLTLSKDNDTKWDAMALSLFRFQYENNKIYRSFCDHFIGSTEDVTSITDIPFLPISFFKTHNIITPSDTRIDDLLLFKSSGTTGADASKHYILDESIYIASSQHHFTQQYGSIRGKVIVCLLPNYLEQGHSSLVYMCDHLIRESQNDASGFYLYEWQHLIGTIKASLAQGSEVILIGVSYALIDFAQAYPDDLSDLKVIETGGMKGRKEEWTKEQLHEYLKKQWNLPSVHSEYGMTELLSQSYSHAHGIYTAANTQKYLVRDMHDPLSIQYLGHGLVNIIDLANIHSCAFIATDDIGRIHPDLSFEILGRKDHAMIRGCSSMWV